MGIWHDRHKDKAMPLPERGKDIKVECPFCGHKFLVWLKPDQCIAQCPIWSCKKEFVVKEQLRPEYR